MKLFNSFRKLREIIAAGSHKSRSIIHLLLVLALNLAIALPVTASTFGPAPLATIFIMPATFHMSLEVPDTICVGSKYPVKVAMRADFQRPMGGINVTFSDLVIPGIPIDSTSSNTGVATLSPPRSVSGFLQNDLLPSASFGSSSSALGEVTFMLQAIKAGSTTISFQATVPAQLTQSASQNMGTAFGIQVENCKYRVSNNGRWSASYPNLTTTLTETTNGMITKDASGQLTGTADVTWSLRSFSVMCSHSHSLTLDHAQLTGQPNGDYLNVSILFGPVGFSTVNCGSSNNGDFQPPQMVTNGSASGYTAGGSFPFPVGNEMMNGRWIMSVIPIKGR